MSKVIVGFDARKESTDALVLGKALARAYDAEIHVAKVLPRPRVPFEEAIAGGQVPPQPDELLDDSAGRILGNSGFIRASLEGDVGGRSAARALHEYAEEQGANLIVVGSSRRGKLGRILPGSVGESLLRGAPCAVAVAPRGFARRGAGEFRRIGVAYDGSDEAELALEAAERLAGSTEADLQLITVVPTQPSFQLEVALSGELLEDLRAEFRGVLEAGLSKLDEGRVDGLLEEGDPAVVLAERGSDLDLLVMGSRGYGPLRSALLGATSAAVMRSAPCPVLVTPRARAQDDRTEGRAAAGRAASG
jgi:nucleotide-binding universal stress UspA family protein